MNSFDHKNRKENYGATRSRNDRSETSFNREDSRRSTREENALSTFSRDKRPRPQRTSTTEGQGGSASGFRKENNRRRSFNPNFTKDNRRTDQVRSTRRDDTPRSSSRYGYYRDENTESAESPRYTGVPQTVQPNQRIQEQEYTACRHRAIRDRVQETSEPQIGRLLDHIASRGLSPFRGSEASRGYSSEPIHCQFGNLLATRSGRPDYGRRYLGERQDSKRAGDEGQSGG